MRVLFIPWGQATHYFHMVPLAWACRAAGHEVRIAAQPGAAAAVAASGLTFTAVGRGYDLAADSHRTGLDVRNELLRRRALLREHYRRSATALAEAPPAAAGTGRRTEPATFLKAADAMAEDLVRLGGAWRPDLVIADPFVLAAPMAADPVGAPLVHQLWGPAVHRQIDGSTTTHPGSGRPTRLWPGELGRLYARFGLAPRPELAVATIDGCPDSLQYPGLPHRIPMRYVPYNGPGSAPDWLLSPPERPRVCVTWGTLTSTTAGSSGYLVPRVIELLSRFDVEVVVTVNLPELARLGDPPAGSRYVANLPLHLLLPSCAALVHQGGAGATLTAAALGVPQLALTGLLDQTMNGKRVTRSGAGFAIDWADADGAAIEDGLTAVLADRCRQAARRLRDEVLAQPSPAEVVGELERIVARRVA